MNNVCDTGEAAYSAGCEHYRCGDLAAAKQSFRDALTRRPEDPQSWFALGNCYDGLKRPLQAEVCFRKSLQYSAADAKSQVYFNLGNSLLDQRKFLDAIECYEKVTPDSIAYESAQRNLVLATRARQ